MKIWNILAYGFLFIAVSCNKSDECPYGRKKNLTTQTATSYFTGNKNGTLYKPFYFGFARKNVPDGDAIIYVGDYNDCGIPDYVFSIYFSEFSGGP